MVLPAQIPTQPLHVSELFTITTTRLLPYTQSHPGPSIKPVSLAGWPWLPCRGPGKKHIGWGVRRNCFHPPAMATNLLYDSWLTQVAFLLLHSLAVEWGVWEWITLEIAHSSAGPFQITSSQGTRGENNASGRAEEPQDGAHGSSFMQGPGTRGQGGTCARPHRHTRYTHLIPAHTCTYAQHTPAGSRHMSHTYQTHTCTHTGTLTPYPDITDTQMQTHITLRGTPRTTDAQTHRDTCDLSWVIKQGVPLHPTILGHIPGALLDSWLD